LTSCFAKSASFSACAPGVARAEQATADSNNALPVHRLRLAVGAAADAPAAYVRALDLGIERLDQRYERLPDDGVRQCFHYAAPRFAFECRLRYDEFGLVLEYPGLAVRAA